MAREREKMSVVGGGGVWWLVALLFAMAIVSCSARNTVITSLSGSYMVVGSGRSLKAMTNDYGDPSANREHDPRTRVGSNGNRRNGDNP